jgi:GTP-binding protein HflX
VPQLLVFNKLDALETAQQPLQMCDEVNVDGVHVPRIFLSAHTGEGIPALRTELARRSRPPDEGMTPEAGAELHDAAN